VRSCQQVIYHLNNRNEDKQFEVQELTEQYESTIEQLLLDTAEKVDHYKQQLDQRLDEKRLQEAEQVRHLRRHDVCNLLNQP
jgi:hypothetical protein